MSLNVLRLVTLGRLDLLGADGAPADPSLSARRRKIALLVLLVSTRRPVAKDTLLEMFWGEQDETRARHSLSDALSHLRRVVGRTSIVANQSTAAIDPNAPLAFDAVEFAAAVKDGRNERALELYGGPFLDGVHVDGSSSFEQWVAAERHRLSSLFGRACGGRASELFDAGQWEECAEVARRWLECEPASSDAARYRLRAIAGPGTREAAVRALQEFDRLSARLQSELGLRPDAVVAEVARELAARVRAGELPAGHTQEFSLGDVPSGAVPPQPIRKPEKSTDIELPDIQASHIDSLSARSTIARKKDPVASNASDVESLASKAGADDSLPSNGKSPRKSWLPRAALAALLVVAVITGVWFLNKPSALAQGSERTVIALTDFEFVSGDSAQAWMADGLGTMLASRLSRSAALELISPDRVREIIRGAKYPLNELLGTERSRDVGARAGANWVVSGALSKADTLLRLEITVRDVKTGKVLRVSNVTAKGVLDLTDAAAAQLLDVVDPAGSGARLTDLETSSQEAYQHFIAYWRYSNGVSHTLAKAELDQALALDSGFISAIIERRKWARNEADKATELRLDTLFAKHESRANFWDRTTLEAERIFPLGEVGRTLALYRELVARYPRDPRAYALLWSVLSMNGEWQEAERVALRQLAIDSLAATAGTGVCAPCGAISDIANTRLSMGDDEGAEKAARRLLQLQPDLGGGWALLTNVLLARGKYDEGLEAYRRARVLNPEGGEMWVNAQARHLIIANRLADADTMIATLEKSSNLVSRQNGMDIRALWYREQRKWPEALAEIDKFEKAGGELRQARLMRGNTLAHMGDYAGARGAFESLHASYATDPKGDAARWFAWSHTLMGDALAPTGDTTLLKILADSAILVGSNSYYARDKMVPHYLRGLVALRGNRIAEAEREFRSALYSRNGFTRVNVALARLLISRKQYKEAEDLLRQALMGPLDAMPRYQPRSEVLALIDSVRGLK